MAEETTPKPIHSIILDAGPIIKGEPSVSTLLQQCEQIVCSPAVLAEIRDLAARQRIETTLKPFLILRTPKPDSVKVILDFARKTGDIAVLSKTDIQLIALAYELELERNDGDWRLRRVPGQKRINGSAPVTKPKEDLNSSENDKENLVSSTKSDEVKGKSTASSERSQGETESIVATIQSSEQESQVLLEAESTENEGAQISETLDRVTLSETANELQHGEETDSVDESHTEETDQGDDSDGWITPSNIKRKQLEEDKADASGTTEPKVMQVAMITTDFAMQNVLLQMNLNLLSPSLQRVRHIKTFVLRCHACFTIVRDMSKQFCTKCGGDTLTRVTCSTNHKGEFQLHFKKNFRWNNRGAKYSIPKPVAGASNQRVKGGGKGGWGNELILSEDQKEYVRAVESSKREKRRDLMDEDYLPSILTGDRSGQGSRIRVGAGKHVNSRKR